MSAWKRGRPPKAELEAVELSEDMHAVMQVVADEVVADLDLDREEAGVLIQIGEGGRRGAHIGAALAREASLLRSGHARHLREVKELTIGLRIAQEWINERHPNAMPDAAVSMLADAYRDARQRAVKRRPTSLETTPATA